MQPVVNIHVCENMYIYKLMVVMTMVTMWLMDIRRKRETVGVSVDVGGGGRGREYHNLNVRSMQRYFLCIHAVLCS